MANSMCSVKPESQAAVTSDNIKTDSEGEKMLEATVQTECSWLGAGGKTRCFRCKKASEITLIFLRDEHQPALHPAKHVALLSL